MPLSSARLSRLRNRAENYLIDSCAIYYPTYTSDGMGGQSKVWTARGTSIPCYLAAASAVDAGNMAESGNRVEVFTAYMLYLAHDQAIASGDKVVLDSRTYRVEVVVEPDTARATVQASLTLED